jgi:hypothetical protein
MPPTHTLLLYKEGGGQMPGPAATAEQCSNNPIPPSPWPAPTTVRAPSALGPALVASSTAPRAAHPTQRPCARQACMQAPEYVQLLPRATWPEPPPLCGQRHRSHTGVAQRPRASKPRPTNPRGSRCRLPGTKPQRGSARERRRAEAAGQTHRRQRSALD